MSFLSTLLNSSVLTVVLPNLVFASSVTQPKKFFVPDFGASGNLSPVFASTLAPSKPLATYPSSP